MHKVLFRCSTLSYYDCTIKPISLILARMNTRRNKHHCLDAISACYCNYIIVCLLPGDVNTQATNSTVIINIGDKQRVAKNIGNIYTPLCSVA